MTSNSFDPKISVYDHVNGTFVEHLAKVYRNNQWRQCNVHYYELYPLKSAEYDEIIYGNYGTKAEPQLKPIYVANKITISEGDR